MEVGLGVDIKIKDEPIDIDIPEEPLDLTKTEVKEEESLPLDLTKTKSEIKSEIKPEIKEEDAEGCEIKIKTEPAAAAEEPIDEGNAVKTPLDVASELKIKTEVENQDQTLPKNVEKVQDSQNTRQGQGLSQQTGPGGEGNGNVSEKELPKKSKKPVKKMQGRIEIIRKVIRKFFCKICMEEVPSLDKLVIHLDREHKIRVQGPPRVVGGADRDNIEDLKNASDLLKSVDNIRRTTEPLSCSEYSDDEDDEDSDFDITSDDDLDSDSEDEGDAESSYLKLRERAQRRLIILEKAWAKKINAQLKDPEFIKVMQKFSQCKFCWVESPIRPMFRLIKIVHMRQHADKEFKHCPHCGMPFLYDYQLDKHLEELAVPVVPPGLSRSEAEDFLNIAHPCRGGIVDDFSFPRGGICGAEFANRKCLLFHRTCHDHFHRCPSCEKPYILYSALRKHIQRSHNWESRLIECPVPRCEKLVGTKRGLSSHFIHCHTKEEKELYITKSINIDANEQEESSAVELTNTIVRHNPPQAFWRMITDRSLKTRNYLEKSRADRAKQNKFWGKPQKSSQSSLPLAQLQVLKSTPKVKVEINDSVNRLVKPSPGRITKRSSTTSTSSISQPGHRPRVFRNYNGITSIPPKPYDGGMYNKNRNRLRHRLFKQVCGYCSRSFRTLGGRNRHLVETHKIDFTLDRPYKCPVEGCDDARSEFKYLLAHIRSHPPSVEETLILRSLEEDKATAPEGEEPYPPHNETVILDKTEDDGEEVDDEFVNSPPLEVNSVSESAAVSREPIKKVASASLRSGSRGRRRRPVLSRWSRVRPSSARLAGPATDLARTVLKNFRLGSGYYCPECPLSDRKSMKTHWSVHRHMITFHPHSSILTNPGSVKLEVLKCGNGGGNEMALLQEDNSQEKHLDQDDEIEVEGTVEQHMEESHDDPEFISPFSDTSTLAAFRRCLQQYRLFPDTKGDLTLTCPLCQEEDSSQRTFAHVHNLQRHIFKFHTGSDLLRKSTLEPFIVTSPQRPERQGILGRRSVAKGKMKISGFRGAGRVNKMKAKAITFSRGGVRKKCGPLKGKYLSPLSARLVKYKTQCGTKFYCPVCASLNETRTFSYTCNVIRHMRKHHPDSEWLTLSQAKQKPTGNRGGGRKKSDTDESESNHSDTEEDVDGDMDNIPDDSDSEIEVEPETEEHYQHGNGFIEVAPPQEIDSDSDCDELFTVEVKSPSKSVRTGIKTEPEVGAGKEIFRDAMIKLEQTTTKVVKITQEPPTPTEDATGRWPCELCPEEDRPSYTQIGSLNRHVSRKHGNGEELDRDSSNSSHGGLTNQRASTSTSATFSQNKHLRIRTESDSNSGSGHSSNNSISTPGPISAKEREEIVSAEISDIRAQTNPKKIQCPLCPTSVGKQIPQEKHVYISYPHLYRHLERSCPVWKARHPENPSILYRKDGCWPCNWCERKPGSRQHLTIHVQRHHPEVSTEEYKAYVQCTLITRRNYTCDRCEKVCKTSRGLKIHRLRCGSSNAIKDEPLDDDESASTADSSSSTRPGKTKKAEDKEDDPSSPRRKLIPRPKRGSAQYYRPSYKDNSSSDEEEFSGTRLQLKIDRLPTPTKIKPEPAEQSDTGDDDEEEKKFPCSICGQRFLSVKSLGAHLSWHKRRDGTVDVKGNELIVYDDDEEDMVQCSVCTKRFPPGSALRAHETWHKRKGETIDANDENKRVKLDTGADDKEVPTHDHDQETGLESSQQQDLEPLGADPRDHEDAVTDGDVDAESALMMDDTLDSVVDVKCPFCVEWFSSPKEKSDHMILAHSNRGLNN